MHVSTYICVMHVRTATYLHASEQLQSSVVMLRLKSNYSAEDLLCICTQKHT